MPLHYVRSEDEFGLVSLTFVFELRPAGRRRTTPRPIRAEVRETPPLPRAAGLEAEATRPRCGDPWPKTNHENGCFRRTLVGLGMRGPQAS